MIINLQLILFNFTFCIMDATLKDSIVSVIAESGSNVSSRLAQRHGVTRQAASTWLARLKKEGVITSSGIGRGVRYHIEQLKHNEKTYKCEGLQEDIVWRNDIEPILRDLPENVKNIWHYVVTEMVNNAIDHSSSELIHIEISRDELKTHISVKDEGEGIFLKIERALNLFDPREAILELAKGKLTTDPANHTGEGIFFSSKALDDFSIMSGDLIFLTGNSSSSILLGQEKSHTKGTLVMMNLSNSSNRNMQDVFEKYAEPDEFTFAKTIVPVKLAQYEGQKLVSRSQAKRLTKRFEKFQTVVLDFSEVEEIGQAFADEVFRVFANAHPSTKLIPVNCTDAVLKMINRVMGQS